jgi:outer membrane lipoprotein SlyB
MVVPDFPRVKLAALARTVTLAAIALTACSCSTVDHTAFVPAPAGQVFREERGVVTEVRDVATASDGAVMRRGAQAITVRLRDGRFIDLTQDTANGVYHSGDRVRVFISAEETRLAMDSGAP